MISWQDSTKSISVLLFTSCRFGVFSALLEGFIFIPYAAASATKCSFIYQLHVWSVPPLFLSSRTSSFLFRLPVSLSLSPLIITPDFSRCFVLIQVLYPLSTILLHTSTQWTAIFRLQTEIKRQTKNYFSAPFVLPMPFKLLLFFFFNRIPAVNCARRLWATHRFALSDSVETNPNHSSQSTAFTISTLTAKPTSTRVNMIRADLAHKNKRSKTQVRSRRRPWCNSRKDRQPDLNTSDLFI